MRQLPKINRVMSQLLSGNEARLEIDLVEMFGTTVESRELRQQIALAIVERIRENTQNGEFLNPPSARNQTYSDSYAESDAFEAYGKSKSDVNLTQSGDMLGLMKDIEDTPEKLVIGWDDSLQAQKAHGHITGNVGVTRNFLGLVMDDLDPIIEEYKQDLPEIGDEDASKLFQPFVVTRSRERMLVGDLIRNLGIEDDDEI